MADFSLAPVEPIAGHVVGTRWDQPSFGGQHHPGGQRRPNARTRLLAALFPGADPATFDVEYAVDLAGTVTAVLIRDRASGRLLRRVSVDQLDTLAGDGGQAGLFLERRG